MTGTKLALALLPLSFAPEVPRTAPPKQSSAIDFDIAKQKRGPQPGDSASGPRANNLAELRQQLTLQLRNSPEAKRILGLSFEEVHQLIPLDALGYRHLDSDLRLESGSSTKHSVSYCPSYDNDYPGELIFRCRRRPDKGEQRQLESLFSILLFPLRNALFCRAMIQIALRDALTGTGNRIAMDQALGRELELARRNLQPLSVLMLDIDHFKRVDDHYGHTIGDEILEAATEIIKDHSRNADMVFRFGDEEFLVLLSSTPLQAVCMADERLRRAMEELDYRHAGGPLEPSINLGCADPRPGEGSDNLLRWVDEALYKAKCNGHNRLRHAWGLLTRPRSAKQAHRVTTVVTALIDAITVSVKALPPITTPARPGRHRPGANGRVSPATSR